MAVSAHEPRQSRSDLAWAISVGGIGIVGFATLLLAYVGSYFVLDVLLHRAS